MASSWCGLAQNNWTSHMAVGTSRADVPKTTWSLVLTSNVTQPHICHPVLPASGYGVQRMCISMGGMTNAPLRTAESRGRKLNLEERVARHSGESQEIAAVAGGGVVGPRPGELEDLVPVAPLPQKTRAGGLHSAPIQPHMAKGRLSRHKIAQRSTTHSGQMSSPAVIGAWRLLPE